MRSALVVLALLCGGCAGFMQVAPGAARCSARLLDRLPDAPTVADALDAAACGLELYEDILAERGGSPEFGAAVEGLRASRLALEVDSTPERAAAVPAAIRACEAAVD